MSLALLLAAFLAPPEVRGVPSYQNDVVAILSRAGCNQGTCHGNRSGKGGFLLSLRGQRPAEDLASLTHDLAARRVDTVSPESSLILLKALGVVPHEGGVRFTRGSVEHRVLEEWIAAGCPSDLGAAPRLIALEVEPREGVWVEPQHTVDLSVDAVYSDGSRRDVRALAVFEAVTSNVAVSPTGRIERLEAGEGTVIVRYLDRQVAVRTAFLELPSAVPWEAPPERGTIDHLVFAKLRRLGLRPANLADDATFLRRVTLDLLGVLPTAQEARAFLADSSPAKREALVDRLLERVEFGDVWALRWSDLLRCEERTLDRKGVQALHGWLRQSFFDGKPLNLLARELVGGRGSTYASGAANYYRALRDPLTRAETTSQVFLGLRLQCSRCHNHPFDRWTQDDYYGWAANFARVEYRILENRRRDSNDQHEFVGEQVVYEERRGEVLDPRTGAPAEPRLLSAEGRGVPAGATASGSRLDAVAEWIAAPSNPFFARAQANRVWYYLMGRGLVDPIDDFRATNLPSHPELLDALASDLVASGFDLRSLVRRIVTSSAYQLAAAPNDSSAMGAANYAHAPVRRLSAEELLDAQAQVAGAAVRFGGYPPGWRAGELQGVQALRARESPMSDGERFLAAFGKPQRLLSCECERSGGVTMSQALLLLGGGSLQGLIEERSNRIGRLLEAGATDGEVLEDLYVRAFSRPLPRDERAALEAYVARAASRREGLEDALWGLLSSRGFYLRY